MERPTSEKTSYWKVAKYISEQSGLGRTLTEVSAELSLELPSASKFKKTFESYHIKYGISISDLEKTSIYDLYQAQTPAIDLVKNAASARDLVESLLNGKDFNAIRKSAKASPKSKPETLLENALGRLELLRTSKSKSARKNNIRSILAEYKEEISLHRNEPAKAEALLIECILMIAELYIDESEE